ncbi:MAG: AraC family ligand binding domain-containing protein, partial [Proteobacteria bacterium]|nr:AraC family ligand binding domain-containing protein [Pseudomonadota bacterium]
MRSVPPTSLSVRDYGASRGSHAHAHFQVLVGLRGVLELEIEGRGLRVGAGQGVVVAPADRHDFEAAARGGSRCLVLDTADAAWATRAGRMPADARVGALARYLALSLERDKASPLALLQGPALLREAWGPVESLAGGRPIDWVALAVWLRAHWHLPLTVADLARQVHLSPSQFSERCRRENG